MMGIASCGLLFNLVMSKILSSDQLPNAFENMAHGNNQNSNDMIELDAEVG